MGACLHCVAPLCMQLHYVEFSGQFFLLSVYGSLKKQTFAWIGTMETTTELLDR